MSVFSAGFADDAEGALCLEIRLQALKSLQLLPFFGNIMQRGQLIFGWLLSPKIESILLTVLQNMRNRNCDLAKTPALLTEN